METIEQTTPPILPITQARPVSVPLQAREAQGTATVNHLKIFAAIGLIALFVLIFAISFRAWKFVLLPVSQLIVRRPETIQEGTNTYLPYQWFTKIKKDSQPRLTFSITTRDYLHSIPAFVGDIPTLTTISAEYQPIHDLPDSIGSLTHLQSLSITNAQLTTLSSAIGNLTNLTELSLEGNQLTSLPDSIGNLKNIRSLNLAYNHLSSLPASFVELSNLVYLDLTGNDFRSFPNSLPPNIHVLFLGGNKIPYSDIDANWSSNKIHKGNPIFY